MTPWEHFMLKSLFWGEMFSGILFLVGIGFAVRKFKTRAVQVKTWRPAEAIPLTAFHHLIMCAREVRLCMQGDVYAHDAHREAAIKALDEALDPFKKWHRASPVQETDCVPTGTSQSSRPDGTPSRCF